MECGAALTEPLIHQGRMLGVILAPMLCSPELKGARQEWTRGKVIPSP